MRTFTAFVAVLVVVLLASALPRRSEQRVVTGTVTEYVAGEWISVANETTGPHGFPITVRETTTFVGDAAVIKPGIRVTVSFRNVGERRLLADTVRVLSAPS